MSDHLCGAHVWRCPGCNLAVAKAFVRRGGQCPRPQCADAGPPTESTCRNPIRADALRCHEHGGKTGHAAAATEKRAAMRRVQGELGALIAEMEDLAVPHPLNGLEDTYALAGRMVAGMKVLVAELDSPLGRNRHDEQVVHPLVTLFGEWMDRYARVQKMTLDADLDQRRAPMDEEDADALHEVFTGAIAALGLTPEQRETFDHYVSTGLRSIAAR